MVLKCVIYDILITLLQNPNLFDTQTIPKNIDENKYFFDYYSLPMSILIPTISTSFCEVGINNLNTIFSLGFNVEISTLPVITFYFLNY